MKSNDIDVKGKLFVLIGRQTFSAGSLFAIELDKYTNAIFIGEPTGGGIQNFGNHHLVVLPNSHLGVMVATQYYQNTIFETERPWLAPQIAVDPTEANYEAGRDPTLAAAMTYSPPRAKLEQALLAVPASGTRAVVEQFFAGPAFLYLGREDLLIQVGYDRLRAKDYERAIACMLSAAVANPRSANAFDSLGDAYLASGQREQAIASYNQALAIAPGWEPSRRSLAAMGAPTPPPAH